MKIHMSFFLDKLDCVQRDELKTVLYTAIYSEKNKQRNNVNRKLRRLDIPYKSDELEFLFPEFFEALDVLKTELKFPPHVEVFKEESRYCQGVLEKGCLELKLPIIPIHDSFITIRKHIPELQDIMDETSDELYRRRLSHKTKF